jgi:hypothetical protein
VGQCEGEDRSLFRRALDRHGPAVELDDRFDDRQPETGAADLPRQRAVDAEEAGEEFGDIVGVNPDLSVVHC